MKNATQIKAEMTDLMALLVSPMSEEREEMIWELYFKLETQLKAAV